MSRVKVKDLKVGDVVRMQTFSLSNLKVGDTKNMKKYIALSVGDKTGSIGGVFWDYGNLQPEMQNLFVSGALIDLSGVVQKYNGTMQLNISGVGPATNTDMSEFEKISEFNPSIMYRNFLGYIDCFNNDWFKNLALSISEEYVEMFYVKPAATGMHHAFKHGLLEHTIQMLETADKLFELPFYANKLNKDLCMFGIMFHDYGKIFEYGDAPGFERTVSGIKVGHIPKMAAIIYHKAKLLEIPDIIIDDMMSVVLSHHGRVAWGSPATPSTPEGIFVHFVDNLHGSVFGAIQRIEGSLDAAPTVKHGFGEDAYNLVKKRFSETLLEEIIKNGKTSHNQAETPNGLSGEETSTCGF